MTLKDAIELLSRVEDKEQVLKQGFDNAHSYRGDYSCLAFEPRSYVTVQVMLNSLNGANGYTFTGYKGGKYVMKDDTQVFIAKNGETGLELTEESLAKMLASSSKPVLISRSFYTGDKRTALVEHSDGSTSIIVLSDNPQAGAIYVASIESDYKELPDGWVLVQQATVERHKK